MIVETNSYENFFRKIDDIVSYMFFSGKKHASYDNLNYAEKELVFELLELMRLQYPSTQSMIFSNLQHSI
jgi:hypothetical protein